MRIGRGEGRQRLRRDRVEERIDRVRIRGLQSGIGLEAVPSRISLVDVVVDASRLHLFVIVAGMGDALAVGAAIAVRGRTACRATVAIEWTTKNRERHATCV